MLLQVEKLRKEDVTPALLQDVAEQLEIGVPIRAWEVVNGRLVLHLAYNQTATWPPEDTGESGGQPEVALIPAGDLSKLRKTELLELAAAVGVEGRSSMLKADLVFVLTEVRSGYQ